jgi:hypothetical protein
MNRLVHTTAIALVLHSLAMSSYAHAGSVVSKPKPAAALPVVSIPQITGSNGKPLTYATLDPAGGDGLPHHYVWSCGAYRLALDTHCGTAQPTSSTATTAHGLYSDIVQRYEAQKKIVDAANERTLRVTNYKNNGGGKDLKLEVAGLGPLALLNLLLKGKKVQPITSVGKVDLLEEIKEVERIRPVSGGPGFGSGAAGGGGGPGVSGVAGESFAPGTGASLEGGAGSNTSNLTNAFKTLAEEMNSGGTAADIRAAKALQRLQNMQAMFPQVQAAAADTVVEEATGD